MAKQFHRKIAKMMKPGKIGSIRILKVGRDVFEKEDNCLYDGTEETAAAGWEERAKKKRKWLKKSWKRCVRN